MFIKKKLNKKPIYPYTYTKYEHEILYAHYINIILT